MPICGPRRGRYGRPEKITRPGRYRCDENYHLGRRLWFHTDEKNMYIMKWELTREEFEQAVEEFDIMSLETPPKIICEDCYKRFYQEENNVD